MQGRITLRMKNSDNVEFNENIGYTQADVLGGTSTASIAAERILNYSQSMAALTTNTYISTTVSYEASLDEIVQN